MRPFGNTILAYLSTKIHNGENTPYLETRDERPSFPHNPLIVRNPELTIRTQTPKMHAENRPGPPPIHTGGTCIF